MYRQNAEISALSSGYLDKYEYLTGKYLQYKPDPLQKVKLEYYPLGQMFNKGLDKNKRSEGLLKRIKDLEDKADNQLLVIEDQGDRQLDLINNINNDRRRSIVFNNEKLAKLERGIRAIEGEIRKEEKEFKKIQRKR